MIDLHTHILPGLDDGSQDMEDSLEMCALALEGGVDTIVATPHSNQLGRFENFYSEQLEQRFSLLKQAIAAEQLPVQLYLGMEIFASEDLEEKIHEGTLISLNHSRYYLIEFPFDASPWQIGEELEQVFAAGGIPLIAHPERYFCVQEQPALVYQWLQLGCLTQVNKGSPLGRFGRHAARTADFLLTNRLATCVASDAHSPYVRTTFMGDIQDYLYDRFGEAEMLRLTRENPYRILHDKPIPQHGSLPERRRGFFF